MGKDTQKRVAKAHPGDGPRIELALVPPSSPYTSVVREAAEKAGAFFVKMDAATPVELAERVLVVDLTQAMAAQNLGHRVVAITDREDLDCFELVRPDEVFTRLPRAIRNLVELERLRARVAQERQTVQYLNQIGLALSAITDRQELLEAILLHSREAVKADGGTIYLKGKDDRIYFSAAQNDTLEFEPSKSSMPIDDHSLAGFVASRNELLNIDDVYKVPADAPYQPNLKFDEASGYHTRSMLLVPMRDRDHGVIGVLALVNRKPHFGVPIADFSRCLPFGEAHVDLAGSIASQAAVALENYRLYEDIRQLFDDFVTASVQVIEARDPTTAGHSDRVARLTVVLAEAVSDAGDPAFSDHTFSPQQLEELRYASLLHDFGKVGVQEKVLLKANKLYPWEMERVEWRFRVASVQATLECKSRELSEAPLADRALALAEDLESIQAMNKPHFRYAEEDLALLKAIAARWCLAPDEPALSSYEVSRLCIPYGSLDREERREIERHVEHTYQFLKVIPWTKGLGSIPDIAHAHHEKLDGTGYPLGLTREQIPYGARLMAISDIFDALTASDRPYKPAIPEARAVSILREEAQRKHLEVEAVELFVGARLWERAGIKLS